MGWEMAIARCVRDPLSDCFGQLVLGGDAPGHTEAKDAQWAGR
jgi:hypothetical protein